MVSNGNSNGDSITLDNRQSPSLKPGVDNKHGHIDKPRRRYVQGIDLQDIPISGWRSKLLTIQIWTFIVSLILVGCVIQLVYGIVSSIFYVIALPYHQMQQMSLKAWAKTERGTGTADKPYKVVIVGSGFSGLGLAIRLKMEGMNDFIIMERKASVGGTWRDNSYPGCACDIPSNLYSFSFEPYPEWSKLWSPAPEIRTYLEHCATKYGITPEHTHFNTEVAEAKWDDETHLWCVSDKQGKKYYTRVLVNGQGFLSDPQTPNIKGLDKFKGKTFHSATWDHSYNLKNKTVAVVGSGASAVQFVPQIQPIVKKLHAYQRTASWVKPHPLGGNSDVPESVKNVFRKYPLAQKFARMLSYWLAEGGYLVFSSWGIGRKMYTRECIRHIYQSTTDPDLREKLIPTFQFGCKRMLLTGEYIPALCQPNVQVHDSGLTEVTENGVIGSDGVEHKVDCIIFGTGFAVQRHEADNALKIVGQSNARLHDVWKNKMDAYKGTVVERFPNYCVLLGPNTNLGHNSVVYMAECQAAYILDCLRNMSTRNITSFELKNGVQRAANRVLQQELKNTVWNAGQCQSWYLDKEGNNTIIYPNFTFSFFLDTMNWDSENYKLRSTGQKFAAV